MKVKTTKFCKRKGCNKEFKLYRSTDKYCSPACAYADQESKPKKTAKPIAKHSEKRKKENYLYSKKRKVFLALPENKYCPVGNAVFEGLIPASEFEDGEILLQYKNYYLTNQVHHKAGRRGKLLLYVPYWLAVSDAGHKWIHANPEKAYQLGFLLKSSTVNL